MNNKECNFLVIICHRQLANVYYSLAVPVKDFTSANTYYYLLFAHMQPPHGQHITDATLLSTKINRTRMISPKIEMPEAEWTASFQKS